MQGTDIRCSLDGKLVTEARDVPGGGAMPLYATASRDNAAGDVILKVINFGADAQPLQINLVGVKSVEKTGTAEVLAGQPSDVNTLEAPTKIAPKTGIITGAGKTFPYTFPPYSVSVLRVKAR